jgi:cytochrome P450
MNLLFPDRVLLTRDPLGFLLNRADRALTPLTPLSLGFHRVHLISDLALIKDGPFGPRTLCVSNFPSAAFAPIAVDESCDAHQITNNRIDKGFADCSKIINGMIPDILIDLRKSIFAAYKHASFDCWRFSTILATKLTFTTLFGSASASELDIDQQSFTHHAEKIYSTRDWIALDTICERKREAAKREKSCKYSLQEIYSMIQIAFNHRQAQSVCGYAYKRKYDALLSSSEICQLVLAVRQATAEAFFWAIFEVARDKYVKISIEEEADACLSSNGELDWHKLHLAGSTRKLSLEIIRLFPINNIIVFILRSCSKLSAHRIRSGDKIVISPYAIFRSERYFSKASTMLIDRDYDTNLLALQYLACGGGLVFQIVLLNLALLLLDLAAAFELELVEGPPEVTVLPSFQAARPDVKVRLNLRRSRLFR